MATKIRRPWNSAINIVSMMHYSRFIRKGLRSLGYVLFPDHCLHCSLVLDEGERHVCTHCRTRLNYTDHFQTARNELLQLFYGRVPITFASAFWYFDSEGPSHEVLHAIKYAHRTGAAREFGFEFGLQLAKGASRPDALCPIPLHPSKQRKRGYNQAEEIAIGISQALGIPVWNGLERTRKTSTQTNKNALERMQNVEGVFRLKNGVDIPNSIALVDDVVTTGSTLESALLAIPPQAEVGIYALAWAMKK